MVDSIKITALQDIGANIAYTTLVPLVNMAGTPTTQKSNLHNLGNLILNGAGGSYFARAAQANLALSVANASQPNITSVGTLTVLTVAGNINAGNINGGNIVVANFYYGDGRFLTNVVANSSYSNSNVANYLPTYAGNVGAGNVNVTGGVYTFNLSSTGLASLTTLNVSATSNLGGVGNVKITGGSAGQKLTTDGNGNLSWTNDANSSYGDSNVVSLLSAFGSNTITTTGNVSIGNANVTGLTSLATLTVSTTANLGAVGNITITGGTAGQKLTTNGNGVLSWTNDANSSYSNNDVANYLPTFTGNLGANNLVGLANANLTVYSNAGAHSFTFADDGTFYSPDNAVVGGSRLSIGPGANTLSELEGAVLVASSNSSAFIQGVIENVSDDGSADWVAQGHYGDDNGGYVNFGFNSSGHSDANHTISGPGDGYVLVDGYANGQAPLPTGGNLVLVTSSQGLTRDIVFATGGFLANNEFARFDHANDVFHLTRANSAIKFSDDSIQGSAGVVWTTAPLANTSAGTAGEAAYDAGGNLYVCVTTNTWAKFAGTTSW